MIEEDVINFVSLHFEGDALEWWYHGMSNEDYRYITSFEEFIRLLAKRFD